MKRARVRKSIELICRKGRSAANVHAGDSQHHLQGDITFYLPRNHELQFNTLIFTKKNRVLSVMGITYHGCLGFSLHTLPCARLDSQTDPCPTRMLSPPGPDHCCTT